MLPGPLLVYPSSQLVHLLSNNHFCTDTLSTVTESLPVPARPRNLGPLTARPPDTAGHAHAGYSTKGGPAFYNMQVLPFLFQELYL